MGCGICKSASKFATSDTDFRDEYEMGEKLGAGTYGIVYDAKHKKEGKTYAVKLMEHETSWLNEIVGSSVKWDMFLQELDMLQRMNHQNVIHIYDVFVDAHFCYVVMDKYASDLIKALGHYKESGKSMTNAMLVRLFVQMTKSIQYINTLNIVHRDVKADNFLVDSKGFSNPDFNVILTDLGTACVLVPGSFLTDQCGTRKYWAPEVIRKSYSHPVDLWAVGVTLYGFITGSFPFKTENEVVQCEVVIPQRIPKAPADLLRRLLDKDPNKRINCEDCLNHRWVKQHEAELEKKKQAAQKGATKAPPPEPAEKDEPELVPDSGGFIEQCQKEKKAIPIEILKRREKALQEINEAFKKGIKSTTRAGQGQQKRHTFGNEAKEEKQNYTTEAAIKGEGRKWEWWDKAKCKENAVAGAVDTTDSNAASEASNQRLGGLAAVKLPWSKDGIENLLVKYAIDTRNFGVGEAKTLAAIAKEMLRGESYFMEGKGRLIRVTDLVVMRVTIDDKGTTRYLVEVEQEFPDGRKRDRNLLPGAMKRPHEDQIAVVRRILLSELQVKHSAVKIHFTTSPEILEEEKDSPSYPGVTSMYRKVFVEGFADDAEAEDKQKLGLADTTFKRFSTKMPDGTTSSWEWWDEKTFLSKGITLRGKVDDSSAGYDKIDVPWTEQSLSDVLTKHKVDLTKYGTGDARTIARFAQELSTGESALLEDADSVVRILEIVVMRICKDNGELILVEASHQMGDQVRVRNVLPGTKKRPKEDVLQAAKRLLDEVAIDYVAVDLELGNKTHEEKESPSYPGIKTVYLKHMVKANIAQDGDAGVYKDMKKRLSAPTAVIGNTAAPPPEINARGSVVLRLAAEDQAIGGKVANLNTPHNVD